jgi:hypothetical protein
MGGLGTTARERARSVLAALILGGATIALAIVLVLSRSPLVPAGANSVRAAVYNTFTRGPIAVCQVGEELPRGTTAIRLGIRANNGPAVSVTAFSGSRVLTRGSLGTGWRGVSVAIPVRPVGETVSDVRICYTIGPALEGIGLVGEGLARGQTYGRIAVEYLRPGPASWWSLAEAVAHHMSLGRAPGVAWVFLIPIVLMALALAVVAWTIVRRLGRDRRTSALVGAAACAAVACLSAASWSLVMPPFEVPDEPSHFAYAQDLAETGELRRSRSTEASPVETAVLNDLQLTTVRFDPALGTISSAAEQRHLERDLAAPLARVGRGVGVAAPQPPLYYALETIPYYLGSSGNLLDQFELMRLLSALMAGLTALFVYLFLREALPAVPWAWTVGGLCTALAPLVGFMSGAVNPDAQLCAVSAALFYCLARAFRRGLTPRAAIAIGAVTAIGFLTKLNFIGLAPGILLALILLARRVARTDRRAAYRSFALTMVIGAVPVCVYALINTLTHHPTLGLFSSGVHTSTAHTGSLLDEVSYIWQYYLPRLPGMSNDFPGFLTTRQLWFNGAVGLYGWIDTYFPRWVYNFALLPAALIAALAARELIRARVALRRRGAELLAYAAIAAGLLVLVASTAYSEFPNSAAGYAEPRYLLPLAVLFAAILALAARGAGRRWGPAVGTLIVLLILAHDIFSQLLVVGRYYF